VRGPGPAYDPQSPYSPQSPHSPQAVWGPGTAYDPQSPVNPPQSPIYAPYSLFAPPSRPLALVPAPVRRQKTREAEAERIGARLIEEFAAKSPIAVTILKHLKLQDAARLGACNRQMWGYLGWLLLMTPGDPDLVLSGYVPRQHALAMCKNEPGLDSWHPSITQSDVAGYLTMRGLPGKMVDAVKYIVKKYKPGANYIFWDDVYHAGGLELIGWFKAQGYPFGPKQVFKPAYEAMMFGNLADLKKLLKETGATPADLQFDPEDPTVGVIERMFENVATLYHRLDTAKTITALHWFLFEWLPSKGVHVTPEYLDRCAGLANALGNYVIPKKFRVWFREQAARLRAAA